MVLGPEEVLALACDDLVTSRLVENVEGQGWDVRYGPFDEQDFADEKDSR
jgi:ribosomal protein L16 Arg81 hydroxylase